MKSVGKVALLTGAGSGIGLATARLLATRDIPFVAVGRRREPLDALVKELGSDRVAALPVDITADDAPRHAVEVAIERFGRLDYLINNAGKGKPLPVHETTDEIYDEYLDVLLRAPFRLCREALKVMRPGSAIVNVASSAALVGVLRSGAYAAAKAGLVGLTRQMAVQYGAQGIRSNAVSPGVTETPMTDYAWDSERFRRMNFETTPMDRTCTAEDVAHAIMFLLSDQSGFINGQVLPVDGGWTTTRYLSDEALDSERVNGPGRN